MDRESAQTLYNFISDRECSIYAMVEGSAEFKASRDKEHKMEEKLRSMVSGEAYGLYQKIEEEHVAQHAIWNDEMYLLGLQDCAKFMKFLSGKRERTILDSLLLARAKEELGGGRGA